MADDLVPKETRDPEFEALIENACREIDKAFDLFAHRVDARITALHAQNRKLVEALTKINVGEGWAAQIARAAIAEAEKGEG